MPKVANYFVRPEGVTLSLATVKDVQYGKSMDGPKEAGCSLSLPRDVAFADIDSFPALPYRFLEMVSVTAC